nr:MAG TPA: hypothetical protein [Caudoviricetes sp.]
MGQYRRKGLIIRPPPPLPGPVQAPGACLNIFAAAS